VFVPVGISLFPSSSLVFFAFPSSGPLLFTPKSGRSKMSGLLLYIPEPFVSCSVAQAPLSGPGPDCKKSSTPSPAILPVFFQFLTVATPYHHSMRSTFSPRGSPDLSCFYGNCLIEGSTRVGALLNCRLNLGSHPIRTFSCHVQPSNLLSSFIHTSFSLHVLLFLQYPFLYPAILC